MVVTNVSSRAPKSRAELTGSGTGSSRAQASSWKEGSIVSLKLRNFLVYKDAKAIFGPRLNMVVGPNGSGKSTLVCAIALGLGGTPKVLARADHLSSFVMHGARDDASVTVELYMPSGPNLIIKRTFSRKNNKSLWAINDRPHTEADVKAKIRALGIQVDNLCTMLPQDKVGDFSSFTPDKLLLETEKALSFESLFNPHNELVKLQENKGKTQNEEEALAQKLEGMETELSGLEQDKQRFEEREEKERKLDMHKKRKLWIKVEQCRDEGVAVKEEEKSAQAELKKAEADDRPLEAELAKWEREAEKLRSIEKSRSRRRDKLEKAMAEKNARIEAITGSIGSTQSEITNLESRRNKNEEKLFVNRTKLEQERVKADSLREKVKARKSQSEIAAEIGEQLDKIMEAKKKVNEETKTIANIEMDIRQAKERIDDLTNQAAVREQNFRRCFRDEGRVGLEVRDWAFRNSSMLKGPVIGPIGLEVTVNDPEAATAVETHIPKHIWCSVVVSCKEDHDTIIQAFRNQKFGLGILVNQGGRLGQVNSAFSPAEMAQLKQEAGLRGFLDEFIECPDTVRQVLRRNTKIHTVFLGSAKTQQKIARDQDFLGRLGKKGPDGVPTGSAIYAGGSHGASQGRRGGGDIEPLQLYRTKISLYGARKPSVRVSETRQAQVVGPGLDNDAIAVQKAKMKDFEMQLAAATRQRNQLRETASVREEELEKLKNERSVIVHNHNSLRSAEVKITTIENIIRGLEDQLAQGDVAEREALIKRLEKNLEQLTTNAADAHKHASDILDVSLELMAATFARRVVAEKQEDARDALENARSSRADLAQKVAELRAKKKLLLQRFREELDKANHIAPRCVNDVEKTPTEFGMKYDELPDNLDELNAVIEDLTEDLSNSVHNPQVVDKYRKLKAETEAVRAELDRLVAGNANAASVMNGILTPWRETLEHTVEKLDTLFRDYMSNMDGCYGEVKLAENDSFKKWGIEIRVRFRSEADEGKLSVLDHHVHSGGERSVSTILFLMALQDLQSSPFRVVDEINQGMDPKNERQVFSRIVLNSCGPNRKQYFLITPKLLQGLVAMDNEDMTVIFIMNGPSCITGTDDHTMEKFISAKKRQLALKAGEANGPTPQRRRVE